MEQVAVKPHLGTSSDDPVLRDVLQTGGRRRAALSNLRAHVQPDAVLAAGARRVAVLHVHRRTTREDAVSAHAQSVVLAPPRVHDVTDGNDGILTARGVRHQRHAVASLKVKHITSEGLRHAPHHLYIVYILAIPKVGFTDAGCGIDLLIPLV